MTRYVVDAGTVLDLASGDGTEVSAEHELLAPTLLRSQTLSALHESVQRGELAADVARERLARIERMPIRLLGDAVLRRRAWDLAEQLGWASTYDAEYVALTLLQADAFVTLDAELARSVDGIVATASIDVLRGYDRPGPEARLAKTELGLVPESEGWFVLNAGDATWVRSEERGQDTDFEGKQEWTQLGFRIQILGPGQRGMYHRERGQEGFLVVSGECMLLIEGEERRLKAWDFVHCPPGRSTPSSAPATGRA